MNADTAGGPLARRRKIVGWGLMGSLASSIAASPLHAMSSNSTPAAPGPVTDGTAPPRVAAGRIERWPLMPSRHVDARHIDVWLPRGYDGRTPHAVLYMHDGQMLFDASTTWNRQAWSADQAAQKLIDEGRIPPMIIVGVWNNGPLRHSEYFPEKHLRYLSAGLRTRLVQEALQGRPRADAYLRFLVEELKPAVDARYATHVDRSNTLIMGSSMGGLISVYAMNEYPQVFGAAAGLSTHWIGIHEANAAIPLAAMNYLQENLADPVTHRLYQDHGTTELDALYAPYQPMIDQIIRDRGYPSTHFMTRVFEGTGHNERAWAQRLHIPMEFALKA